MEEMKARPPFVQFEIRAAEDRAASIAEGRYIAKDVIYAIITPAGSKDRIERVADEWFRHLAEQVAQDRFDRTWYAHYKQAFADWKEGREPPVSGTDIRQWPVVSPAQLKLLMDLKVRSVEDLAAANEETIMRLGMGGRALKDKAVNWLASAKSIGQASEALSALQVANQALTERNAALEAKIQQFEARLQAFAAGGAGAQAQDDNPSGVIRSAEILPL